jgi:hypothetical protein
MYVCMFVCTIFFREPQPWHVFKYAKCMYVCMYVCMYEYLQVDGSRNGEKGR